MSDEQIEASGTLLSPILDATFRANPAYQLVLFDRLAADQQEFLRDLTKDPDFYGVLLPLEGSRQRTKSACQSTALLLLTLAQPGKLPAYIHTSLGVAANQAIAEMVLDGVLEMELDGRFVSGTDAYDAIYSTPHVETHTIPLSDLTTRALEYAKELNLDDSTMLSGRLYSYNRIPLSSRWKQMFPDSASVEAYLGVDSKGALQPLLAERWQRIKSSSLSEGWIQWSSRDRRSVREDGSPGYKLYVSPMPDLIQKTFATVVECLSDSEAYHFKVGDDAMGLLRPDKIVLYFYSFEAMRKTADMLAERLRDCPAQGVPFTAALDESGLLSWGADPPRQDGVLAWQERESWRMWVTNRIATAMIAAKESQTGRLEPWRFALERLRLDHVDTDTWTPLPEFGRSAAFDEV
jgi:hypothetical protein